MVDNILFTVV